MLGTGIAVLNFSFSPGAGETLIQLGALRSQMRGIQSKASTGSKKRSQQLADFSNMARGVQAFVHICLF